MTEITEKGFPWDGSPENKIQYGAQEFSDAFASFINNGVKDINNDFIATVSGTDKINIGPGIAWICGKMLKFDGISSITLPSIAEDDSSKYYRGLVVLRLNTNSQNFCFDTKVTTDNAEPDCSDAEIPIVRFRYKRTSLTNDSLKSAVEPAIPKNLYINKIGDAQSNYYIEVQHLHSAVYDEVDMNMVYKEKGTATKYFTIQANPDRCALIAPQSISIRAGNTGPYAGIWLSSEDDYIALNDGSVNIYVSDKNVLSGDKLDTVVGWGGDGDNQTRLYFKQGALQLNKNGTITNIETWTSDRSLKTNILDSDVDGMTFVKKIKHRKFKWIDGKSENIGYIAQELQDIDPSTVESVCQKDGSELLQVRESVVIPYLSKALQELINKVETLDEEIKTLKSEEKNG